MSAAQAEARRADEPEAISPRPFRLCSDSKDALLRRCLPQVEDERIQQIFDDPALILYTDEEMPRAYQDWATSLAGVHSPRYNISANDSEPFGNGNIEFPWGTPAGTHRSDGVTSCRFLWLPTDDQGKRLPVVWFRTRLPGDSHVGYGWRFPVGAVLGEVLMLRGPDNLDYTFEVRVRVREHDSWAVDVFRPFPTAASLAARIKELRPDWEEQENLRGFVEFLEKPTELEARTLSDASHPNESFRDTAGIDRLPSLGDDTLVGELLTSTTFNSALGAVWREGTNDTLTFAPTTDEPFHVVPAKYDAGFISVDRESCLRCHETVSKRVDEFEAGRDWYGRIRGSDGIFSFHPFDPGSISYNGYGQSVSMRQELIDAGVLDKYDPEKHPLEVYHSVNRLLQ
jgi:hypothetical protein